MSTAPIGSSSGTPDRVPTLVAAGAAPWEATVLEQLSGSANQVVLVKRCLDLTDLLATAATGTASVALVSHQLPGLDADSVDRLTRAGVRVVAVTGAAGTAEAERMQRLGVARVLPESGLSDIVTCVRDAARSPLEPVGALGLAVAPPAISSNNSPSGDPQDASGPRPTGRLVAVWGPTGAPGRTTVAIGIAAEASARGVPVTLLDADPYGGAVAQHLAVLDDASGLLAAARAANSGTLDAERLSGLARQVGPHLRLVTGLPRPDRWPEVRAQAFADLLDTAREMDELVVVDSGFGLSREPLDPFDPLPQREAMTMAALEAADDVVVVASADPVGLTRLARGLLDVVDVLRREPALVIVNRMRPGLGWASRDVVDMVSRVAPTTTVLFLPDDRAAADRALVAGQTLPESGESSLRRAMAEVATRLLPTADDHPVRLRSAGRRRRALRR